MLSLQFLREHPEEVRQGLRRLHTQAPLDEVLRLDADRRAILQERDRLRAERKAAGREIGRARDPQERERIIEAQRGVSGHIDALEAQLDALETRLQELLLLMPNLPLPEVPEGAGESENRLLRHWGEPPAFPFQPLPHWELGPRLGIIDFERGVKMSGSRFFVLLGAGARLERALISWMLDLHTAEHGYQEVYPPVMVTGESAQAAGDLPKFADTMYHDAEEDLWWIPTAEMALANLHRDEILPPGTLPLRYVSYTPCFRREKVSAGREVRGIKRVHQFDKVELFAVTEPEASLDEFHRIVANAEEVLRRLDLPYRVVEMCTGDLGFKAAKKYDLEAWAPGSGDWLEVSSISSETDFQARRANIRYRDAEGRLRTPHTLNGSGLALPRTMIALLESYQQPDGSVLIPQVLRSYMGGLERITAP